MRVSPIRFVLGNGFSRLAERKLPGDGGINEGLGDDMEVQRALGQAAGPCTFPTLVRFQLPTPFFGRGQDGDRFGILNSSQQRPAEPGKVQVQMETGDAVTWWKQLDVVDCRGDLLARDFTQQGKHSTIWFTFDTPDIVGASLLLWKAKAFGVHTPMYQMKHLEMADGQSWTVHWGGD